MIELKITQYNVWKNKKKIMSAFLLKIIHQKCRIMILQKLWQNLHMNVMYCFSNSEFWFIYSKKHHNWVCFLISKKIFILMWTIEHSQFNLLTLTFLMKDMIIHIHNIYSSLSEILWNIDREFFIYHLQQVLSKSDKHLLIKDFNIHHLTWKKVRCMQQHNMMNDLIQIVNKTNLTFLTLSDIIIRKFNE